jgi:hypothetical protein
MLGFLILAIGGIVFWHASIEPIYRWPQLSRLVSFSVVFALLALSLRFCGQPFVWRVEFNDAIVAATAFILLWYTLETYAMRWEMVEQTRQTISQTEHQLRPVVTLVRRKGNVCTANLGKGLALNLSVDLSPGRSPASEARNQVRLAEPGAVSPGECVSLKGWPLRGGIGGADDALRITYKNLEGIEYFSTVRVESGEYLLEKTDRVHKKDVSARYDTGKTQLWWLELAGLFCFLSGPFLLAIAYQEIRGGLHGTVDERGKVRAFVGVKYEHLWFPGLLTMVAGSVLQVIAFFSK